MSDRADVPPEILDRLRAVCLALPDAYEQPAWIGTRWRIRSRTIGHAYVIDPDEPRDALVAAVPVEVDGPTVRLTFRARGDEVAALVHSGHPFYRPPWASDVVMMVLGPDTDWTEVEELLTESYCLLAPKKLAAKVIRP
jgi:hypothetical protein